MQQSDIAYGDETSRSVDSLPHKMQGTTSSMQAIRPCGNNGLELPKPDAASDQDRWEPDAGPRRELGRRWTR